LGDLLHRNSNCKLKWYSKRRSTTTILLKKVEIIYPERLHELVVGGVVVENKGVRLLVEIAVDRRQDEHVRAGLRWEEVHERSRGPAGEETSRHHGMRVGQELKRHVTVL